MNAVDQMRERCVAALVAKSRDPIMGIVSKRNVVSVANFGEHPLSVTILTLAVITIASGDSIQTHE